MYKNLRCKMYTDKYSILSGKMQIFFYLFSKYFENPPRTRSGYRVCKPPEGSGAPMCPVLPTKASIHANVITTHWIFSVLPKDASPGGAAGLTKRCKPHPISGSSESITPPFRSFTNPCATFLKAKDETQKSETLAVTAFPLISS